jgi:hypothetical protein
VKTFSWENAAEPDELFDKLTATEQDLSGLSPDEMERIYDQIQIENDIDYHFDRILDHVFKDGTLELRVQYRGGLETHILDVPFTILKKDVPLELARYIRAKVIDAIRHGFYNTWAKQTLKNHNRCVRRLYHVYNVDSVLRTRRAAFNNTTRVSRNTRNAKEKKKEKFGIRIPRNTKEALIFDKENNNSLWAETIAKEMDALHRLDCFEFHEPNFNFKRSEGWQFASMHMIYDVKQEDLRHKARFVVGGHMVDSTSHITYSSTIQDITIRLLMILSIKNQ